MAAIDAVYPLVPVAERGDQPAERFVYRDGGGEVGVIASVTQPFCGTCDRVRLTAEGQFRTCLFAVEETDLRAILRGGGSDDDLAAAIAADVATKWAGHSIDQVHFIRPQAQHEPDRRVGRSGRSMSGLRAASSDWSSAFPGAHCPAPAGTAGLSTGDGNQAGRRPRLTAMSDRGLTHLDPLGRARMVDVTPKEPTHRRAIARGKVFMLPETTSKVASNAITKGDVLGAARVAGIQAAKRTPDLIPLCHPLLVGRGQHQLHHRRRLHRGRVPGRDHRPHRRRDGGAHRLRGRRPHDLRHVQVERPVDGHRRDGPVGEDRRQVGHWRRPAGSLSGPWSTRRPPPRPSGPLSTDDGLAAIDAVLEGQPTLATGDGPDQTGD